jgi:2-keto-3-deoxy-L-rhamnonate aldolase RhmA
VQAQRQLETVFAGNRGKIVAALPKQIHKFLTLGYDWVTLLNDRGTLSETTSNNRSRTRTFKRGKIILVN